MTPFLGIVIAFLGAQDPPAFRAGWRTSQDLTVEAPGRIAVDLPLETLDAAQAGLEDLRVLGPSGREVPWTLGRTPEPRPALRPAEAFSTVLLEGATQLIVRSGLDAPLGRLELDPALGDFVKAVRVEESPEGLTWTLLREGEPLYWLSGGVRKTHIDLPPARRPYLRLTLDDRGSRPVPILAVRVGEAPPPTPLTVPLEIDVVERREEPARTHWRLRVRGRHARLAEVSFDTPEPVFRRRVRLWAGPEPGARPIAEGVVFRSPLPDQPPVEVRSIRTQSVLASRDLELIVENGDSPPLRIDRFRARAHPLRIHFAAAEPGLYRLLAGNPGAVAPQYDVAALGEPEPGESPRVPGPLHANPGWTPPEPVPGILPGGAPLDPAAWRFRKEVRLGPGTVHDVELDLDVLSGADPSGQDLRLIRNGLQIPFLRDDPPRRETIALESRPMDPPPRGRPSQNMILLPRRGLRIERIFCQTRSVLFRREVRVVEESGRGGELQAPRVVGRATWERTPGDASARLEIAIGRATQSRELVLQIEDGDNPPLDLHGFEAELFLPKLVFKAAPGTGLYLLYGNRQASAPEYDLALVAPELSRAIRTRATLGPEEPDGRTSRSEEAADGAGRIFLWVVLAALTVALVAVILKVLPAPADRAP